MSTKFFAQEGEGKLPKASLNYWMRSSNQVYVPRPEARTIQSREPLRKVQRLARQLRQLQQECKQKVRNAERLVKECVGIAMESLRTMGQQQGRSRKAIDELRQQLRAQEGQAQQASSQCEQAKMQNNLLQMQNSSLARELKALNEAMLKHAAEKPKQRVLGEESRRNVQQLYVEKMQLNYRYESLLREKEQCSNFVRELQARVNYLEGQLMGRKLVEREHSEARERLIVCELIISRFGQFQRYANDCINGLKSSNLFLKQQLEEKEGRAETGFNQIKEYEKLIVRLQEQLSAQSTNFAAELEKLQKQHGQDTVQRIEEFKLRSSSLRQNYEQLVGKQALTLAQIRQSLEREQEELRKAHEVIRAKEAEVARLERERQEDLHERSAIQFKLNQTSIGESKLKSILELQQSQSRELKQQYQRLSLQFERVTRQQLVSESTLGNTCSKVQELQRLVQQKSQTITTMQQSFRKQLKEFLSQSELKRIAYELQARLASLNLIAEQGQDWHRFKQGLEQLLENHTTSRKQLQELQSFHLKLLLKLSTELLALQQRVSTLQQNSARHVEKSTESELTIGTLRKEVAQLEHKVRQLEQQLNSMRQSLSVQKKQSQSLINSLAGQIKEIQTAHRLSKDKLSEALKEQKDKFEYFNAQLRAKQAQVDSMSTALDQKSNEAKLLFDLVHSLQSRLMDCKRHQAEIQQKGQQIARLSTQVDQLRKQTGKLSQANAVLLQKLHDQKKNSLAFKQQNRRLESRLQQINGEQLRLQAELERFVEPGTGGRKSMRPAKELVKQLKQEYKQKYDHLLRLHTS